MQALTGKKLVDNILSRYYAEGRGNDDVLYSFWKDAERSVSCRIAYELANRLEDGENIVKKYGFGDIWTKEAGIYVSLPKISKNVWIPENFENISNDSNKSGTSQFQILRPDELNVFNNIYTYGKLTEEQSELIRRVAYCQNVGQQYGSIGRKRNLFIEDSSWRNDVRKYAVFVVQTIQEINLMDFHDDIRKQNPDAEKMFAGIDFLTTTYLSEMTQKMK